jgi:DNA-binding NarL/FixJ family response regulator/EAL domain-containing protein (putative c-di-GMP-specific phosphodiesterase class I)
VIQAPPKAVTVLIADDDPEFQSALAAVVDRAPRLELVGVAGDATQAVRLGCRLLPAVAVVDVRMGEGGGVRVASHLARFAPDVRVLALSAYDDHATVRQMLDAGASGYLLKGTLTRELVEAIERTAGGDTVLPPGLPAPRVPSPGKTGELASRWGAGARAEPIRVILADDHPEFLDALASIVQREADFELVGKARDTPGAVRLATMYQPDVALVDWRMPGGGGVTAIEQIARVSPHTRVMALSSSQERDVVLQMLRAGASSYVVKSVSGRELVDALRTTAAGGATLSPEAATPVIEELVVQLARSDDAGARHAGQEATIRSIIDDAAFTMAFQPIVSIDQDRVMGVEALARFDVEPKQSPDVWFGQAAAVGLGVDLDLAAARRAVSIIPDLPPGVDLFLNLSPDTIFSGRYEDVLAAVPGERVVLELTEHAPVHDYKRLSQVVGDLRNAGFRIAVDDVGAGYASLRHLLNLAPDMLKIDISLCRLIEEDRARQLLAKALTSLGRELGATVLAEGIESGAELGAVRELGVDYAQGFFLGRPASPPLDDMLATAGTEGHAS